MTRGGHVGGLLQGQYRASRRLAFVAGVGPSLLLNGVPVVGELAGAPQRAVAGVWCAGAEALLVERVGLGTVVQSHGIRRQARRTASSEVWVRKATVVPNLRVGF